MTLEAGAASIRLYVKYHPYARINFVEYRGRTVWMTQKQFAIWLAIQDSRMRNRRKTLADIAERASRYVWGGQPSRASVSRFLRKLDLWRFINLATVMGRRGGAWIVSRRAPSTTAEQDARLAGAKHTWASRKIARDRLAAQVYRRYLAGLRGRSLARVLATVPTGSTGATFTGELFPQPGFGGNLTV